MAYLLGPITAVSPSGLTSALSNTTSYLSTTLLSVLQNGQSDFRSFSANSSSVSITAVSTRDNENYPFFDFHFAGSDLNITAGSATDISKHSIYRIGSISKLFTVYTLLVGYGLQHWDNSITNCIPELRAATPPRPYNPIAHTDWNDITIGDLASQSSGIERDYANADLATQSFPWTEAGLPNLPQKVIPTCGAGNPGQSACNRTVWFQGLVERHPVYAPATTPTYSNAAFRLLGYVLEALSTKSFAALVQSVVLQPFDLSDTSAASPPTHGSWVIPNGDSAFFEDVGDETPTAGIYSSSDNLARFGRNILLNKQLSALDTRRWMKPKVHTSSLYFSVGSPWEIWRTHSLGLYSSYVMLIPDYGVAISILTAGSSNAAVITIATELVLQSLIPALEAEIVVQACESMCGIYKTTKANINSSLAIASDANGLFIDSFINNGVDIKNTIENYAASTGSNPITTIRLQATNLQSHSDATLRVAYRALFEKQPPNGTHPRVLDPNATLWSAIDENMYGSISADDLVVSFDSQGYATQIEPRIIRDTLNRADEGHSRH
ncbi:putative penicillin-binding protein [Xylariaceae sp. FL0255]|nr:putative penicillin-binding protein [Xylariaceae sp. FL0255]